MISRGDRRLIVRVCVVSLCLRLIWMVIVMVMMMVILEGNLFVLKLNHYRFVDHNRS